MARIEISSVSNPYGTGELQLQGKVAMSGTLTSVTDNLNTASPLKLSTGVVQVVSTLRVTTNDNPYFDAEDGAGNNRFTIGRDSSSQQVNVDFASNPTGSTTIVGAIRTYVDGTNLSEIMTFREDGNVGIGTTAPTSKLSISSASATILDWSRTASGSGYLYVTNVRTGGSVGTVFGSDNFSFRNASLENYIVSESNRLGIGTNNDALTARLQVKGTGSTSATTSLLVQNSVGSTSFQVRDDLTASVGNGYSGDGIRFEAGNNSSIVFRQGSDRIRLQRENSDRLRIDARGTSLYIGEGISTDANANTWLFEGINNTPVAFDNTKYIKIFINGVAYKLAVCI